jgi:hypothetical protein
MRRPSNSSFTLLRLRRICPTSPTGQTRSVQPSPTESNRIQPNPTTPPPPGKETGKETVKFLALFDYSFMAHLSKSDHIRPNPTNFSSHHSQPATCNLQPSTPISLVSFSLADCRFQPRQPLQNLRKYRPAHMTPPFFPRIHRNPNQSSRFKPLDHETERFLPLPIRWGEGWGEGETVHQPASQLFRSLLIL